MIRVRPLEPWEANFWVLYIQSVSLTHALNSLSKSLGQQFSVSPSHKSWSLSEASRRMARWSKSLGQAWWCARTCRSSVALRAEILNLPCVVPRLPCLLTHACTLLRLVYRGPVSTPVFFEAVLHRGREHDRSCSQVLHAHVCLLCSICKLSRNPSVYR